MKESGPLTDPAIGVVVIGRNEGERLRRCLNSIAQQTQLTIYVDSGSTDGSVEWARAQGFHVLDLDTRLPFTAARARNAGFARLVALHPEIQVVQFVDGDCEVVAGWLQQARDFIARNPAVAVVCGRRRERFPEASIFNAHCDLEWDTPVGDARACGGDAMMRCAAFIQSGGYRESLIAGEEPELCLRIRAAGFKVWRIGHEMTLHDAAILTWKQWWRRTRRSGYAFAQGSYLHGGTPEKHWVAETRRAVAWGAVLPLTTALSFTVWWPAGLLLASLIPAQIARLALRYGSSGKPAWRTGTLLLAGRLPEAAGVARFWLDTLTRRHRTLIEYK